MKTKIFTLTVLSILALIVLVSSVSAITLAEWPLTDDGVATSTNTNINAGTFESSGVNFNSFGTNGANAENWSTTGSMDDAKYFEVTISPKSGHTLTISNINFDYSASITGPASFELQYSKDSGFASPTSIVIKDDVSSTGASSSNNVNIKLNEGETLTLRWFGYDFNADTNEFRIKDLAIDGTVTTIPIISDEPEEVQECNDLGNPGDDLRIRHIDITNKGMKTGDSPIEFGDDNSWFPLDDIEVDVEVENKGSDDIDNIEVDWGLWDTQAGEWTIEPHDEKDFDLRDDDSETMTITFNIEKELDIDLEDLDDGDHYQFYVIATGESRENDQDVCANDYEDIGMVVERDFVVLNDFQFPETVSCGDTVPITAEIWNIGDRDQDDVYVRVYNTELGIDQTVDVGNLDAFEKDDLTANVDIPKDADEKSYLIRFDIYNEDDDVFETDFDEDKASFPVILKVSGCKANVNALVSASLESGGNAGEELTVRATVVNTGTDSAVYTISADGYSSWATLSGIQPTSLTLNPGASTDVMLTFNVNDDVEGEQSFNIGVSSSGETILTQPVSVTIQPKSGFAGITGGVIGSGNTYIWVIGALNIILVIIIIIVAVRVARR